MADLPEHTPPAPGAKDSGARLLGIVRQTLSELRPHETQVAVGLHSALDRDLGLDSLGRVELWSRIEREFEVRLPEQLFASAETPADVLDALQRLSPAVAAAEAHEPLAAPEGDAAEQQTPEQAQTLIEVLQWHCRQHPQRIHVHLLGDDEHCEDISYQTLQQGALAVASGLQRRGVNQGERVALMLPTGRDFLFAFFGSLLAGAVPVPIYPPMRLSQIEEHLRRQAGILRNAETLALIVPPQAKLLARLIKPQVPSLREILTVEELSGDPSGWQDPGRRAEDLAFLQYTSGSTGQPKGVMVSHANVLTNLRAMGQALRVSSDDVFVSWLPMYHDMGLIGAWLGSLYYSVRLALMSPLAFLARPARWLWTIDRYRGTLSSAPNFAYELCLGKLADADLQGLDLSSWRLAFNGAEPVNPDTLERFAERFAAYGLVPTALSPVYGLAEGTLGVSFPPLARGPRIERIQRGPFQRGGKALPAEAGDQDALRMVGCGMPLPGHQIRVVDEHDLELPERCEGHVQFKGPSNTRGYFRNPGESRRVRHGDWLDSLDLGYIAGGELFLSGRVKDLIIRAGRNIYPYDVEIAVGNLPGLRKGCVAVFGSGAAAEGGERLVVLAETHERDPEAQEQLRKAIRRVSVELIGLPPDDMVLAPAHTVLKTSSGKIRRAACRQLYERGELGPSGRPLWRQVLGLVRSALQAQLGRAGRRLLEGLYAGYFWSLLGLIGSATWLAVLLLPGVAACRRLSRGAARLFLRLAGLRIGCENLEQLDEPRVRVLVANHASYLDGLVLCACLPPGFAFVAKRELAGQFVAGRFLRKIGACFVERFELQRSAADAERLHQVLAGGQSLVIFPEGTLSREPGLRAFHMGAFVLAARAAVPLLPLAISGTRAALRGGQWFPRRAPIEVSAGQPLRAGGQAWRDAIELRDQARAALLERLDEPDLGQ